MRALVERNMAKLIEQSQAGEKMNEFYKGGWYDTLNREILEDIEREAFHTLKNPEFDPSNLNMVYQLRALCQTVDKIRERIEQKISDGVAARIKITEYNSTPKEGE